MLVKELSKKYNPAARTSNGLERGYLYGKPLVVIMYQFLRVGEAVELRVKDIDFDKDKIHVRRQYDEQHKLIVPPKWGSRRDIPIASVCRDILENACDGKQPNELVFSSGALNSDMIEHGGHILRGGLRRVINVACEHAGLEKHTIHDLRHDGISWIVRRGAHPQSVQKWAGHKSLSVTLDRYFRHTTEDNPEDMALMTGTDN
ncbi:MAG: site-specific integrase [Clostridia bacterium]|nr:site-specific integrase [Clostridia bacterium]